MAVHKTYLVIKESQIPDAGKGLFTSKDIIKGSRIVEYTGTIKKWKDLNDVESKNKYLLYVNKDHVIDAENQKECFAIYANDAKGPTRNPLLKNNTTFLIYGKKVFITANRKISAGEEIFVGYGKEYWEHIEL